MKFTFHMEKVCKSNVQVAVPPNGQMKQNIVKKKKKGQEEPAYTSLPRH